MWRRSHGDLATQWFSAAKCGEGLMATWLRNDLVLPNVGKVLPCSLVATWLWNDLVLQVLLNSHCSVSYSHWFGVAGVTERSSWRVLQSCTKWLSVAGVTERSSWRELHSLIWCGRCYWKVIMEGVTLTDLVWQVLLKGHHGGCYSPVLSDCGRCYWKVIMEEVTVLY